jgi:hypothetical protein
MRVCGDCGEMFGDGKLVCPHCGAEPDQPWSEAPIEQGYEEPVMEDEEYGYFLEREGLDGPSRKRRRAGCATILLAAVSGTAWILL